MLAPPQVIVERLRASEAEVPLEAMPTAPPSDPGIFFRDGPSDSPAEGPDKGEPGGASGAGGKGPKPRLHALAVWRDAASTSVLGGTTLDEKALALARNVLDQCRLETVQSLAVRRGARTALQSARRAPDFSARPFEK